MASKKLLYFHPRHGLVQVKRGFSWPALLFGSLWALARRMYALFLCMLVVDATLWFITGYAGGQGSVGLALVGLLGTLAYAVIRGKYGNRWAERFLAAKGYTVKSSSGVA